MFRFCKALEQNPRDYSIYKPVDVKSQIGLLAQILNSDGLPCLSHLSIPPDLNPYKGRPSNYEEIYLNRSEILRGLKCHILYTVPIDVVYSDLATNFDTSYHNIEVVPMMMVRNPNGDANETGLKILRELICQRVRLIEPKLERTLEGKVSC